MNETDKAILSPRPGYASVQDFTPEWIAQVNQAIAAGPNRDGNHPYEVRPGFPACIEVGSDKGGWHRLNLPTNGCEFESVQGRDEILARLHG
jgi:hypothetical protein